MVITPVAQSVQASQWAPAEAVIDSSYVENKARQYKIRGSYRYNWQGQDYSSDRFFFDESVGIRKTYYRKLAKQLSKHKSASVPIQVWVNSKHPDQAVIYRYIRWDKLFFNGFFSSIFLIISGSPLWFLFSGTKQDNCESARRALYPDEPWRWQDKWQSPILKSNQGSSPTVPIGLAIFTNVIGLAILHGEVQLLLEGGYTPWRLFNLVMTALGFACAYGAYQSCKFVLRYKNMAFELKAVPVLIGGELRGEVILGARVPDESELRLVLSCKHTDKSSEDTKTQILWHEEKIVLANQGIMKDKFHIPIHFKLPMDQPETQEDKKDHEIEWLLSVGSKVFGSSQDQEFNLPVFNTDK